MMSVAQVLAAEPVVGCPAPKHPGDRVMIGQNRGPVYEVIFVHEGTAWIRPLTNGQEGLTPVSILRTV